MAVLLALHMATFDPIQYSGAWYEVASHKAGFYGLGQYDCMDTRGLYEYDPERDEIDVRTQCRHLDGRISGIKGIVKCSLGPPPKNQRGLSDCTLRFPTAPYVPPTTYRVLETDYSTFALIEGGTGPKGLSPFVQIYSRYPRPGNRFIEDKKRILQEHWGYDAKDIHATPVTLESDQSAV